MAYDTRPQYGASSRPYRGAQTAPLQVSQEYNEDGYIDTIGRTHELPGYAVRNNQQQQQQHYDIREPSAGMNQSRPIQAPSNGRWESQFQGQGQYGYPGLAIRAGSSQRPVYGDRATQSEDHRHGGCQPEPYDSFTQKRVAHQNSSQSIKEDRSMSGGHLRYERGAMPPPRSYSNDNVSWPYQYQSLPDTGYKSPTHSRKNEPSVSSDQQSANQAHAGSHVRLPKPRNIHPNKLFGKERIAAEPSSPETLGWDNPFPTFPINKKKSLPSDVSSFKGSVSNVGAKGALSQEASQHQRSQTANSKRSNEYSRNYENQIHGGEPQREPVPQSRLPIGTKRGQQSYIDQSTISDEDRGIDRVGHGQQPAQQENGVCQSQRTQQNGRLPLFGRQFEDLDLAQSSLRNPLLVIDQQRSRTLPNEISETMARSRFLEQGYPVSQPRCSNVVRNYALPHRPIIASNPRYVSHEGSQSGIIEQNQNPAPSENHFLSRQKSLEQHGSHIELYSSYSKPSSDNTKPYHYGGPAEPRSPLKDLPDVGVMPLRAAGQSYATTTNHDLHIQSPPNLDDTVVLPYGSSRGRPKFRIGPSEPFVEAHRSQSQPNVEHERRLASSQNNGFDFANGGRVPELPQLPSHGQSIELSIDRRHDPHSTLRDGRNWVAPARQLIDTSTSQYDLPIVTYQGDFQGQRYTSPEVHGTRLRDGQGMYINQGRGLRTDPHSSDRAGPMSPPMNTLQMRSGQIENPGAHVGHSRTNGTTPPPSTRPYNPDTLPEHPVPVRPGLLQPHSNSMAKPPPVRQYDGTPSTVQQKTHIQPFTSPPNIGKERSTTVTHEELELLKQTVRAKPDDHGTQLLLAKKTVEAASVLIDEGGRADQKQRNKNRERYILDAHKLVKKLVNVGYSEAMFYLADCHGRGQLGLAVDPKEAFNLYQSAAKAGHPQSAYRVAVCCEMGQEDGGGTRRDPLKAIQWYKRAATLGDTPAMYKMGMIQLKGLLGQSKNPREAIVWLKRAADRADAENPHALHELGLLFENASGNDNIVKDEAYSRQLFTQAAELGYKFSQFRLGSSYEYGLLGFSIDPRQSIAWYSKAAVQEEHQSELALSGWYLTGSEGVLQQSDTEAYLWARKAAQAGLAKAEYAMGYFTEVGIGAPANIEDAKRWYWRAAAQNYPKARERLEDLRKGGARMQKSRVSRSAVKKGSDGECAVM